MDAKSIFTTVSDDFKNQNNKFVLSKFEDDLYKEEANVKMPIVRVKHIALPNKGDRWKIFVDDEVKIVIEGLKLNKKERVFLRGLDGVSWLIGQAKAGAKSFNAIRLALKSHMKTLTKKSG
jgi:hypothetical protein